MRLEAQHGFAASELLLGVGPVGLRVQGYRMRECAATGEHHASFEVMLDGHAVGTFCACMTRPGAFTDGLSAGCRSLIQHSCWQASVSQGTRLFVPEALLGALLRRFEARMHVRQVLKTALVYVKGTGALEVTGRLSGQARRVICANPSKYLGQGAELLDEQNAFALLTASQCEAL